MASELKPFGYAPGSYMNNCKSCGQTFMGDKRAWNCEPCAKALSLQADTRPAPAATDTGLVTVGGEYLDGHTWKPMPAGVTDFALRGFKTRALCDRSQAEELLAAERAAHNRTDELLIIAVTDCHTKDCQIKELQADNAAQAARIKELNANTDTLMTECHRVSKESGDQFREMRGQIEALETKLAAATETAARAAYRACAETRHVSLGHAAADAVRAALGGKPS